MSELSTRSFAVTRTSPRIASPLFAAACGAIVLGLVLCIFARPGLPFWLDESWTGAIVAQDSLADVVRQTLLDAHPPLYFALLHGWSLVFGLSNEALRFPSLIFGVLAGLVAFIPVKAIPREVRYLWAALLALWFPGILYSQEARGYTLLLFLSVASTVAFARVLERPDLKRAALWMFAGALCILTHYHALVLVGLQGLTYLAWHRVRALRTWAAALILTPALGWAAMHLPHVARFADPQYAWFDRLGLADLPGIAFFALGGVYVAIGLAALGLIAFLGRGQPEAGPEAPPVPLFLVVAPALAGILVLLAAATVSTSFTTRYLIPFVPGLLLAIAAAATQLGRRSAIVPLAVVTIFAFSAVSRAVEGRAGPHKVYNYERASDALMAAGVHNLVFLWDNPLGQIWDRGQLAALGGFFFKRAGYLVTVEALAIEPGQDPNRRLLDAAGQPGTGILWLYDLGVRGTAAKMHPPRIAELDPGWTCRQFGDAETGVVACSPGPAR
jgi:hypothetical protein